MERETKRTEYQRRIQVRKQLVARGGVVTNGGTVASTSIAHIVSTQLVLVRVLRILFLLNSYSYEYGLKKQQEDIILKYGGGASSSSLLICLQDLEEQKRTAHGRCSWAPYSCSLGRSRRPKVTLGHTAVRRRAARVRGTPAILTRAPRPGPPSLKDREGGCTTAAPHRQRVPYRTVQYHTVL